MADNSEQALWNRFKRACELMDEDCRDFSLFRKCLSGDADYCDAYTPVAAAKFSELWAEYQK
jgi:hypothetical protein